MGTDAGTELLPFMKCDLSVIKILSHMRPHGTGTGLARQVTKQDVSLPVHLTASPLLPS